MSGSVARFPEVEEYLRARGDERVRIAPERLEALGQVARFVRERLDQGGSAALTFICTHNSRRSHLAQLWAQIAAEAEGLDGVCTYSGGTEVTALHPNAIEALRHAGLRIETAPQTERLAHHVWWSAGMAPVRVFSKIYDRDGNPTRDFCAVMTCTDADRNCPIVQGAALRVALPFEDPKRADGTPQQDEIYRARCAEIAREMIEIMRRARLSTWPRAPRGRG